MDPPPPSSSSSSSAAVHVSNPDDSTPRPRAAAESWVPPPPSDEPVPAVPGGGKLRLMCSYGGHIVPRPHDKSLCYVGGDTRIVVVDRGSTLADLCGRLSKTLLQGRPFTLKYQLPSEDLDSLISVTTDEDLDNMIDEYDRTVSASSPLRPSSRLRLFLFFVKPETSASMGALLDDAKSETWFVDALNGSGLLPRGLSDSAVDDCLLSLDLESQGASLGDFNKHVAGKTLTAHESLHYGFSAPDSPLVDNTNSNDNNNNSSFGSSSSSPSMSNLPPIRVRVADDQRPGSSVEEQFAQISFALPQAANPVPVVSGGDSVGGVGADDERSDHGAAPVGFRKPPLPLQPVQPKSGGGGGYGLPSPDSVASDSSSIASASSLSKPMYYQDQHHHHPPLRETRGPASPNTTSEASPNPVTVPGTHILQQSKDPGGYLVTPHLDPHHHHPQIHQQYVPAGTQYVHQPMQPYYQVYPQTPQQFHHHHHHPIDQQYPPPLYMMSYATADPAIPTSRPGPASAGIPPVYPAKAASPAPPPAQITPTPAQLQQHYVGYSQISHHHPSRSVTVASSSGAPNYVFEHSNPAAPHEQVFYATPMPSQYQSMTPAAAIALSEAAKQLPTDNTNAQQQIRTSQPL